MHQVAGSIDHDNASLAPDVAIMAEKSQVTQLSNTVSKSVNHTQSNTFRYGHILDELVCTDTQPNQSRRLQNQYLLCLIVVFSLLLPFYSQATETISSTSSKEDSRIAKQPSIENWGSQPESLNPRSKTWRKVREGSIGYSAVSGPEAGQLIESNGEVWRRIRNGPLAVYGAWAMVSTIFLLALFYTIRGKVMLTSERTGKNCCVGLFLSV